MEILLTENTQCNRLDRLKFQRPQDSHRDTTPKLGFDDSRANLKYGLSNLSACLREGHLGRCNILAPNRKYDLASEICRAMSYCSHKLVPFGICQIYSDLIYTLDRH